MSPLLLPAVRDTIAVVLAITVPVAVWAIATRVVALVAPVANADPETHAELDDE